MLFTCDKCQTQYKLDPARMKPGGQTVRCTECGNSWFAKPEKPSEAAAPVEAPKEAVQEASPPSPPPAPEPKAPVQEIPPAADVEFQEALVTAEQAAAKNIPAAVKPAEGAEALPVIDNNPAGMGALQFGLCTFLLLLFTTLIPLLVLRGPIVRHAPVMAAFYESVGISMPAPGEGLRLSEMTSETRVVAGEKKLFIEAKLTNQSSETKDHPRLRVDVLGPYGASLKYWIFQAEGTRLASGDTIPVTLSFESVPADGQTVEMRVVD